MPAPLRPQPGAPGSQSAQATIGDCQWPKSAPHPNPDCCQQRPSNRSTSRTVTEWWYSCRSVVIKEVTGDLPISLADPTCQVMSRPEIAGFGTIVAIPDVGSA